MVQTATVQKSLVFRAVSAGPARSRRRFTAPSKPSAAMPSRAGTCPNRVHPTRWSLKCPAVLRWLVPACVVRAPP